MGVDVLVLVAVVICIAGYFETVMVSILGNRHFMQKNPMEVFEMLFDLFAEHLRAEELGLLCCTTFSRKIYFETKCKHARMRKQTGVAFYYWCRAGPRTRPCDTMIFKNEWGPKKTVRIAKPLKTIYCGFCNTKANVFYLSHVRLVTYTCC